MKTAERSIFCITYKKDEAEDNIEIIAYSKEQAIFLSGISNEKIVNIECSVSRYSQNLNSDNRDARDLI